jgi:hypothetical protein
MAKENYTSLNRGIDMRDNSSKTIKLAMEKSSTHSKIKYMSGNLNTTKDTVKA